MVAVDRVVEIKRVLRGPNPDATCELNCRRWRPNGEIVRLIRCDVCTEGAIAEPQEGEVIGFRARESNDGR